MDRIDDQRIAIVGDSAGGYMAMMLNGLQRGTTAAIANGPIVNAYFNTHEYFPVCDKVNRSSGLFDFIMPIQGLVSKSFQSVNEMIGDDDVETWEAVSSISMIHWKCQLCYRKDGNINLIYLLNIKIGR